MLPRSQRRPRSEQTRPQILDAAERHFAVGGFSATRLEDIADDVGIRRAAIFYHFRDKRALYETVLKHHAEGLLGRIQQELARPVPLPDRIEAAVLAWVDYIAEHPAVARLMLRLAASASTENQRATDELAGPLLDLLDRVFTEGERTGVMRPVTRNAMHFVSTVSGATVFFVAAMPAFAKKFDFDPLDPDQLDAHRRDVLRITRRLLGLRGPKPVRSPSEPCSEEDPH